MLNGIDTETSYKKFEKLCLENLIGSVVLHEFTPGDSYNYWIIPRRWDLKKFSLKNNRGELLASEKSHPLVVASYSCSVKTELTLQDLKEKTVVREDLPEAFSFIFRRMYRHWEKDWSISLPYSLLSKLPSCSQQLVNASGAKTVINISAGFGMTLKLLRGKRFNQKDPQ